MCVTIVWLLLDRSALSGCFKYLQLLSHLPLCLCEKLHDMTYIWMYMQVDTAMMSWLNEFKMESKLLLQLEEIKKRVHLVMGKGVFSGRGIICFSQLKLVALVAFLVSFMLWTGRYTLLLGLHLVFLHDKHRSELLACQTLAWASCLTNTSLVFLPDKHRSELLGWTVAWSNPGRYLQRKHHWAAQTATGE